MMRGFFVKVATTIVDEFILSCVVLSIHIQDRIDYTNRDDDTMHAILLLHTYMTHHYQDYNVARVV